VQLNIVLSVAMHRQICQDIANDACEFEAVTGACTAQHHLQRNSSSKIERVCGAGIATKHCVPRLVLVDTTGLKAM
jgi:hypothetical protein